MTRWGFISDVHGNLPALEEGLRLLALAGVERVACLGDYLGRGDSEGCVRLIREVAEVAVLGNRDLDWQDRVSREVRAWVLELPRVAVRDELVVAHGDARLTRSLSTNQIRTGFGDAWRELERLGGRVLVFGHSHHARVWRKRAADESAEALSWVGRLHLDTGSRYFVNVGSAGLPFPGKGGPSVACLDLAEGWLDYIPLIVERAT